MRFRLLLIGSGLALLTVAASARIVGSRASRAPGKLVAERDSLRWVSPAPSESARSRSSPPPLTVVNTGGTPVRITKVTTSCGCATARVEPLLVPPQGKATVSIDSLEVGIRAAQITLETDSPTTPQVLLQVMVKGHRRPPYVFQVICELFYQEGFTREDTRELTVETIELKGTPENRPAVACDLPFLQIDSRGATEKTHALDPALVARTYRYQVGFAKDPPAEAFAGTVSVADPWISGRVLGRNVLGEANRPIRVAPSRLVLDLGGADGTAARVRFSAKGRGHAALRAEPEVDDGPLVVEATGARDEAGLHAFEVRWKPGREATDGVFNVIVRSGSSGVETVTIPVRRWRG